MCDFCGMLTELKAVSMDMIENRTDLATWEDIRSDRWIIR
jgi:hypothetical protein